MISKWKSRMDNPEKLATCGTQDKTETKQKQNTTQYVFDTTMHKANTNNVNKTLGKDESNIVIIRKSYDCVVYVSFPPIKHVGCLEQISLR